jgi:hypothetical protein
MEIRCEGGLAMNKLGLIEATRTGLLFRQNAPIEGESLVVRKAMEKGGLGAGMVRLQL